MAFAVAFATSELVGVGLRVEELGASGAGVGVEEAPSGVESKSPFKASSPSWYAAFSLMATSGANSAT